MKASELIKMLAEKISAYGDGEIGVFFVNEHYVRLGMKYQEGKNISPFPQALHMLPLKEESKEAKQP